MPDRIVRPTVALAGLKQQAGGGRSGNLLLQPHVEFGNDAQGTRNGDAVFALFVKAGVPQRFLQLVDVAPQAFRADASHEEQRLRLRSRTAAPSLELILNQATPPRFVPQHSNADQRRRPDSFFQVES